jgi:type IV secretory pathway VirB2 component (pilin)
MNLVYMAQVVGMLGTTGMNTWSKHVVVVVVVVVVVAVVVVGCGTFFCQANHATQTTCVMNAVCAFVATW